MEFTSSFQILRIGQTMGIKQAVVLALCASLSAAANAADFGLIQLDGAGHATLIFGHKVEPGARIMFQFTARNGRPVCCKRLLAEDFQEVDSAEVLASDEVSGTTPYVYTARVPKLWAEVPFIGVAFAGQPHEVLSRGARLEVREGQGGMRRAETCTSQEGVHLIERVGVTERTHLYLSVGYDIAEPTCQ